jgi:hypothetical protein
VILILSSYVWDNGLDPKLRFAGYHKQLKVFRQKVTIKKSEWGGYKKTQNYFMLVSKMQTYLSDKMHLKSYYKKTRHFWRKSHFSMFFCEFLPNLTAEDIIRY